MRDPKKIICSCGGEVKEVETTDEEEEIYGCTFKQCCVNAFQCQKCNTRFTFELEAPDIND